ncbi:hypothetical protein Leryth_008669, partial [Lithospermum erythrorhizon]
MILADDKLIIIIIVIVKKSSFQTKAEEFFKHRYMILAQSNFRNQNTIKTQSLILIHRDIQSTYKHTTLQNPNTQL